MSKRNLTALVLSLFSVSVSADLIWRDVPARQTLATEAGRMLQTDADEMRRYLRSAPAAGSSASPLLLSLPLPNGEIRQFKAYETALMQPELAAKYPQIKTYRVTAVDNPASSGSVGFGPAGLHAMLFLDDLGTVMIDAAGSDTHYRSFYKQDALSSQQPQICHTEDDASDAASASNAQRRHAARTFGSIRVLRIALSATAEYSQEIAPSSSSDSETKTLVLAEMAKLLSRVNQIYERDLALSLQLVSGTDQLIYRDSGSDPFDDDPSSSDPAAQMLQANQPLVDSVIGSANYDLGHVLSINGGGYASLRSACDNSVKAQGVSGHPSPQQDAYYIDYFSHEVGHQFGGNHTFNGSTLSCSGGNRVAASAFEPGSGTTIMAYAGICGGENVQSNSDALFHAGSIAEINSFADSLSCGSISSYSSLNGGAVNGSEPIAEAGADYVIPAYTPFRLDASQSCDDDNDLLSFSWDEIDAGIATTLSSYGNTDFGNNALFRTYLPSGRNYRDFPTLEALAEGSVSKAELLPQTTREVNFRLVVRDGRSGVDTDDVKIQAVNTGSAFAVTAVGNLFPSAGDALLVSWNVAGTAAAPINCSNVDIDLLTFPSSFNFSTYGVTRLASSEANDGEATVSLPSDKSAVNARIRVSCSNNIFYDISDDRIQVLATGGSAYDTSSYSAKATVETLQAPVVSCEGRDTVTVGESSGSSNSLIPEGGTSNSTVDSDSGTSGAPISGGGGSLSLLSLMLLGWIWALRQWFVVRRLVLNVR